MQTQCYFCGVFETKLFRCAQCKIAWYCSQAHQKSDWKQHRPVCKQAVKKQAFPNETPSDNPNLIETFNLRIKKPLPYNLQYDEYEIALSPKVVRPLPTYTSLQDKMHKLADFLIDKLTYEGYCVIDGFLGDINGGKVLNDVTRILKSGIMKNGELVQTGNTENNKKIVRGDKITWITGHEEEYNFMKVIINAVDRLIRYSKCGFSEYNLKGRTPAMVACYPGDGSGYKRHIDNTRKDGRCITCLYYLNKNWNCTASGGQLRIFPLAGPDPVDIEPIFDRLFVFWSDKRSPHEVLPAYAERFAITLWYFDGVEREAVKEAYMAKLRQAFAGSSVQQSSLTEKKEGNCSKT